MKFKDFIGYMMAYLVAILITTQFLKEFNPQDIISWLFSIPIFGFDILLSLHLYQRVKAEKKDD
jgi:hypothetical protein